MFRGRSSAVNGKSSKGPPCSESKGPSYQFHPQLLLCLALIPRLRTPCLRVWASPQPAPLLHICSLGCPEQSYYSAAHKNISKHSVHSVDDSQLVPLETGKRCPHTQVTGLSEPNISVSLIQSKKESFKPLV